MKYEIYKIVFGEKSYYNDNKTKTWKSQETLMSTLEYTVSMLETMSEEKSKEVQKFIQYIIFRDAENVLMELLSEDEIVKQLTESMEKSDRGVTTPANIVSHQMKEKYAV